MSKLAKLDKMSIHISTSLMIIKFHREKWCLVLPNVATNFFETNSPNDKSHATCSVVYRNL